MSNELGLSPPHATHSEVLVSLARDGLLRVGVPREHGGSGEDLGAVVEAVARTARRSLLAAITLASQRLLIEALLAGENVGLLEYRLRDLLNADISGNCSASWPEVQPAPAIARDTGRGWRITGQLPAVPNLGKDWFLVSVPVAFEGQSRFAVVLLRSDEDRLVRVDAGADGFEGSNCAALELRGVFCREDEILTSDGPALVARLRPLALGLRCAIAAAAREPCGDQSPRALSPG